MGIQEIKKLEKMRENTNEHINVVYSTLIDNSNMVDSKLEKVQKEYHRVVELSGQAGLIINQIDRDFKEKTKLDYKDIIILFFAVGLQCIRQYVFTNDKFRLTAKGGVIYDNDAYMEKMSEMSQKI